MRLIDADAIIKDANEDLISDPDSTKEFYWNDGARSIIDLIETAPTIDPVKHGEWVYKGARGRFPICECSVCGNVENADWAILGDNVNYCPNCGAKMDGGEDDG